MPGEGSTTRVRKQDLCSEIYHLQQTEKAVYTQMWMTYCPSSPYQSPGLFFFAIFKLKGPTLPFYGGGALAQRLMSGNRWNWELDHGT